MSDRQSAAARSVDEASTTPLWIDRLTEGLGGRDRAGRDVPRRPPLDGDLDVDVAVVGGGFSGLWTAWYLSQLQPSARIVVLEREYCGFGASGRNGGWAVGELAGSHDRYAALSSHEDALRLERAIFDAVDEIGRVAADEGIDCDYVKGGNIRVARTRPQAERQRREVTDAHERGLTDDQIRLLGPDEARRHFGATDVRSGIFFAPCAALDPARLVRGLADAVEGRGVTIHEGTTVTALGPGRVTTTAGTVTASVTVGALEAYTGSVAGRARDLLPVYSLMIATEPLPPEVFDEIGLDGRPTFGDDRHIVTYGQRTADDRIAFGSQGVPYRYRSRVDPATERRLPSHRRIRDVLVDMAPVLATATVTHRWGGVLGIPRNWTPAVSFDRASGVATLGGYVGEGVAAANLAGRTLADLIAGVDSDRTTLPWVGAVNRRWEPEPFRWAGVRSSRAFLGAADRREARTDRPARAAAWLARTLRGD